MTTSRRTTSEPVHVIDVHPHGQFVLLSVKAYQVVAPLFEAEDPIPAETLTLVEPVALAAGWLDPPMEAYDRYDSPSPKP